MYSFFFFFLGQVFFIYLSLCYKVSYLEIMSPSPFPVFGTKPLPNHKVVSLSFNLFQLAIGFPMKSAEGMHRSDIQPTEGVCLEG